MITFKLLNYPPQTTTWEVYLSGIAIENSVGQPQMEVPAREGDLVVTLYRNIRPAWRWLGRSSVVDGSTVEIDYEAGNLYLVKEAVVGGRTDARNLALLVGGAVVLSAVNK